MISFDEAQRLIAGAVKPLTSEQVPLSCAAGRVLSCEVRARTNAPPRAVSAMDGYAVVDSDNSAGRRLEVIGTSRPGAGFGHAVSEGQTVRIFTGAPLPAGANRVILQEHVERAEAAVAIVRTTHAERYVRQAASDFATGAALLAAGQRLDPRAMVVAAAADGATLAVARQPRMAILATGDELAEPGTAWQVADAIPDSVTAGVAAMGQDAGGVIAHRARGDDDLARLVDLAGTALAMADVVVVTGGASVGERDFAKRAFGEHGIDLLFDKVAIKPGKPVWLGRAGDTWVLGLPGNPTSAMVTARLFLVPLLAALQGQTRPSPLDWQAMTLSAALPATGDRETFARARREGGGLVPLGDQDSGSQAALAAADWLIRCPAGQSRLQPRCPVTALAF